MAYGCTGTPSEQPKGPAGVLRNLTERQARFVERVLHGPDELRLNATAAARAAGYSSPDKQGSRLWTFLCVRQAVETGFQTPLDRKPTVVTVHVWESGHRLIFLADEAGETQSILAKSGGQIMGGLGSGRWFQWDTKPQVERCHSLDATRFARWGIIEPGSRWSGSLTWRDRDTDEVRSAIGVEAAAHEDGTGLVRLKYTLTRPDGEPEPLDYRVRLVSIQRHFGGRQWYFICPLARDGVPCGRRVAKLYRRDRYFGCRVCHGLAYRSSQEAHQAERNERMLGRIARRHGIGPRRLLHDVSLLSSNELLYLIRTLD